MGQVRESFAGLILTGLRSGPHALPQDATAALKKRARTEAPWCRSFLPDQHVTRTARGTAAPIESSVERFRVKLSFSGHGGAPWGLRQRRSTDVTWRHGAAADLEPTSPQFRFLQ